MPLSTCSMYQPGLQAGSTDRHLKNSAQHFGGSSTWQTRKGAIYTALLAGDKSQVPPDRNIRVASASKQAVSIEGPEDGTDAITATAETPRTRLEITFPARLVLSRKNSGNQYTMVMEEPGRPAGGEMSRQRITSKKSETVAKMLWSRDIPFFCLACI